MIRLVLILIFAPLVAAAQAVTIRSGEHDTFDRLVLAIGVGTQWELEQSNNTVVLRLDGVSDGFDVTQVFERIPRDRIADVTQTAPDALRLTLNCPCDYDAFLWRPGQLVLDIVDGSALNEDAYAIRPVESPLRATQVVEVAAPTQINEQSILPSILILDRPPPYARPAPSTGLPLASPQNDIATTESALAEGIARAASQGFLEPSISQTDQEETERDEVQPSDSMSDSAGPSNRVGIGISTAMDRGLAAVGAAIEQSMEQRCLPADLFRIEEWGNDAPFHMQAAELAEALAGEFGEEPLEAQEALARLYVHFGFGAEARLVLAADPASSRSRLILSELAGIVDSYEGRYPLISTQADCPTPAALWAFLINPMPQDEDSRNYIMQQFFALPNPLRGQISPRLARTFIESGDPGAAERLLSSTDQTDAGATHEVASARAFAAERTDDPTKALAVLSREANDNARTTPESLIRMIHLQLEQGIQPSEADLLLVSTLRSEFEGKPIEQQLVDVEAEGRIAIGQYQPALDLVRGRSDDAAILIINDAFMGVTRDAPAGVFLGFAYGDLPENLTPITENAMASRLIDLGFPERASTLLEGPATREAAADRRYLRADAFISLGDYAGVIDSLLGIEDDRARSIRARAYEGMGEYRAALASLSPDQTESSAALQFRANAWERLTVEDDDALSSFARVVLNPAGAIAANSLADRRAILEQSQESRRAVEGLLLRFNGTTLQE